MRTHTLIRARRRGVAGWLSVKTGRFYPGQIAGGDETPEEKTAREAREAEAARAAAAAAQEKGKPAPTQADLDKAYEKLRAAEAERDALKPKATKWEEHETAQLSERERAEKERDEAKRTADTATSTATAKLRKANLRLGLTQSIKVTDAEGKETEISVADPKAAAKLITGVKYDEDDEPTNLPERVKAMLDEYPLLSETPGKRAAPKTNGSQGGGGDGPSLTAEEAAVAQMFGMSAEDYQNYKALQPKLPDPEKTT